MCFDRDAIDPSDISHHTILIFLIYWNFSKFLVLVPRQYFRNHTRISKTKNENTNLDQYVENYRQRKKFFSLEGSYDVIENCSKPDQNMSTNILPRL